MTECYRDLAASTQDFATTGQYENIKARWSTGREADGLARNLDWDQLAPPETATVIPVGGEDGKSISLPDWFPQVNFEELPESIKAQWPSRPISK